ncbi:hypothetical protein GGX14DRAFT_447010 [Mycena pura]|uniref:Putative zinc-finger domain-containing protein n=1 Tax=Mycena pura TaxID=153505 RepID=A0AAD6VJM3_9AGAR|nr:hypothetical protein GGX14DRAFT_447010 [Mycena pura]
MADQSDVLTTMVTRGQGMSLFCRVVGRSSSQEPRQEPVAGLVDVDSASSSSAQPRSPTTPVLPRHDGSPRLSDVPPPRESNRYSHYEAYSSPFEWYPLLRCRMSSGDSTGQSTSARTSFSSSTCNSQPPLSSLPSSSILSASLSISSLPSFLPSSSTTYSTVFPLPSLRPLTLATCSTLDPTKRICQYETGGGVCRDTGCEDVHLTRLGREDATDVVEPSDADTAEYLFNLLPASWLKEHGVSMATIATALQEARDKNNTLGFEERVARAVLGLGPRPPPPLP